MVGTTVAGVGEVILVRTVVGDENHSCHSHQKICQRLQCWWCDSKRREKVEQVCLVCLGRRKERRLGYRCVKERKDVVGDGVDVDVEEEDDGDDDLQTHWRCYAVSRLVLMTS